MTFKITLLLIYRKKLAKLLDDMEHFWTVESIDVKDDDEFKQKVRFLETSAWLGAASYRAGGFVLVSSFIFMAMVSKRLVLACWIPEDDSLPYFQIMFIITAFISFMVVPLVGRCDSLFAVSCIRAAMQFKLLCKALEISIPSDVSDEEAEVAFNQNMPKIIQYHQFLLT